MFQTLLLHTMGKDAQVSRVQGRTGATTPSMEINVFERKPQRVEIHGCISQKALLVP